MTKLRWTTQTVEGVEAIRRFIANNSDAYADLVVARPLEAVERLELFPRSGRIVPELADPQLREIIESPYRIVYRALDESVEILTVFRASASSAQRSKTRSLNPTVSGPVLNAELERGIDRDAPSCWQANSTLALGSCRSCALGCVASVDGTPPLCET